MEETSDVCFRDLSHLPNMHEPGHCTATLLEDVGGDWSLSGKTVLPDFPEPHLTAIDTTTTASLPAAELSEEAGSKSGVPHPLVTVPLLSTSMIEANHDQAEKQRLPLTQPAAQHLLAQSTAVHPVSSSQTYEGLFFANILYDGECQEDSRRLLTNVRLTD
jgi:hypothetical protein